MFTRKRLLSELRKHLKHRFYFTGQIMPWNFVKFWKESLSFVVMCKRFPIHMKIKQLKSNSFFENISRESRHVFENAVIETTSTLSLYVL